MLFDLPFDQALAQRLPLPLATLYQRAHNAKTPLERHHAAFYLWEAALKLLGAGAVVEFAERQIEDPDLAERLQNLARPALGHWWEFVRRIVPLLAEAGDPGFAAVRDLVLGRSRDDLPGAAGLDAVLVEVLDNKIGARATVRLSELFDRLVRYRNREIGHGAAGQKASAFYDRVGRALLAGVPELLGRLDVLAGRKLRHIAEVRRRGDGAWLVERGDLSTGTYLRIDPLEVPAEEAAHLPRPDRLYLEAAAGQAPALEGLRLLHPFLHYDAEANEALFLNARRGKKRVEYLSYATGRVVERDDLAGETRELLRRVLAVDVAADRMEQWAERSQAEEPAAEEPVGIKRLGEFELLSKLGQGGMGVVYRAWQPSLGRQVAVKCLFRSGDPKSEARFRREIQALGRAEHLHLVKIFTSGSDGDQWFYAMELVEGATLAVVCDRLSVHAASVRNLDLPTWHAMVSTASAEARRAEMPLSAPDPASGRREPAAGREPAVVSVATADSATCALPSALAGHSYVRHVVALVQQVAEAAHALHEKGVVHRDIKPGNIILDAQGTSAVLMDLGLAQLADEMDGRLTRTRQFVGTLRYASPQQVLAVGKLDRRSDVYSLGATLWELLTLRPLYGATEETPTPELMEKIQRDEPAPLRTYHPGIARDLEAIVGKCLEKDPQRRYATAHELAEELGRFLADKPVRARPVGRWERSWRWCRRNRSVAGLAATLLLALIAGVAVPVWLAGRSTREEEEFRSAADQASARAKDAELEVQAAREAHAKARTAEREADKTARAARRRIYNFDVQQAWEQRQFARLGNLLDQQKPGPGEEDLRGFEWYYLRRRCRNTPATTFTGHTEGLLCVAYSPDGQRLASASVDKTVRIWDAKTGRTTLILKGHTARVWAAAFHPDGTRLASASDDRTVKIWDAKTGGELRVLTGHTGQLRCVSFSPDGKRLASGGHDSCVKVWDATTGKEVLTKHHAAAVRGLSFSPDGKKLASAVGDGTVSVWEAATGKDVLTWKGAESPVVKVSFSPDGKRLGSASDDPTVKIWDAITGREVLSLTGHIGHVNGVVFSPNGQRVATAGDDRTVRVWDATTGKEILNLLGHAAGVDGLAFSPDGKCVASGAGDEDRTVKVWDVEKSSEAYVDRTLTVSDVEKVSEAFTFRGHTAKVRCVAFSPDGKRLASCCEDDKLVKVWDAATGKVALTLTGHTSYVRNLAFSPDGKRMATASADHTVKVWDLLTGQVTVTHEGNEIQCAVAFSPDGKWIASGGGKPKEDFDEPSPVMVWDATTGKDIMSLKGHTGSVLGVAFSPDGKRLASAGGHGGVDGKLIKLWDMANGIEVLTLKGHTGAVMTVRFSPDGKRLVSAGDTTVKVWDVATLRESFTIKAHAIAADDVVFSPDGKRLASSGDDKLIKLWDAATGDELLTLRGHTDEVWRLSFSPDGKRLASASKDGTVKIWDAESGTMESAEGPEQVQESLRASARRRIYNFDVQQAWEQRQFARLGNLLDEQKPRPGQEDLRGFEWYYLRQRCRNTRATTFTGHTNGLLSVVYSPDGQRLASGSLDNTVRIWDAKTGRTALILKGHTGPVWGAAFNPDGTRLASASNDGTVKIWDAKTGGELLALKGHTGQVRCVSFSPDGKRLASGGHDSCVKVWDATTGQEVLTKHHNGAVRGLSFSPDGKNVASAVGDGTVSVWEAATGKDVRTWTGAETAVVKVSFSPDGKRLASAGGNVANVWDAITGREVLSLRGHNRAVNSVVFSPNGQRVVSASDDRTVRVWDATTGKEMLTFLGHTDDVESVVFSPDGKQLASGAGSEDRTLKVWDVESVSEAYADRTLKIWEVEKVSEAFTFRGHTSKVRCVAFTPDGKRVASCCEDDTLAKVWGAATGKVGLILTGHTSYVRTLTFNPDGKRLATASADHTVKVWDVLTGQVTVTHKANEIQCAVAFSPDGKWIASGGGKPTENSDNPSPVMVWDAVTGHEIMSLKGHTGTVFGVAFSPDGKRLASACGDGGDDNNLIKVWDMSNGREVLTLKGHTGAVMTVRFSPDGKRLASADGNDGRIKLWDAVTGQESFTIRAHAIAADDVVFSPDGRRLASCGDDKLIKLWDAATGDELLTLRGHTDEVWRLSFSPDGKRLASASKDGTVKVWDAE